MKEARPKMKKRLSLFNFFISNKNFFFLAFCQLKKQEFAMLTHKKQQKKNKKKNIFVGLTVIAKQIYSTRVQQSKKYFISK